MRTKLKVFRVENHLTQEQMAKRCGTSRNNYSFIEQGKRDGSADFWFSLQKEFNVPIEEMHKLRETEERGKKQCE